VEYHANGGSGLWHATCDRRRSGQLSFEGNWSFLLNNNNRELVPITNCSDSKWVAQPSRRCPYCPEFVSVICSGPVVRSYQINLIWINGGSPYLRSYRLTNIAQNRYDNLHEGGAWRRGGGVFVRSQPRPPFQGSGPQRASLLRYPHLYPTLWRRTTNFAW